MTSSNPPEPQADACAAAPAANAREGGPAARCRRWLPGWRPWRGRPQAQDLLCVAALILSGLYSAAMIPLTPLLIASHPMLLEMLAGSNASVVAAGSFSAVHGGLHPALLTAAAMPAMMRSDWILWWAGRRWGPRIVERLGRRSRRLESGLVPRRGTRWAAPLVALAALLPGGTQSPLYAAAGWLGLPLLRFLAADAIGTAAWVSLLTASGYLLGGTGVAMAGLVARYTLAAICVPVLTAIAPHAWRAWRHRPAIGLPGRLVAPAVAARGRGAARRERTHGGHGRPELTRVAPAAVRCAARELWGEGAHSVTVGLWESCLGAAGVNG